MQSGTPAENDGITENQLKVYISASDALSGIDRLTADAGGRTYTAEKLANGEYMLTITYAFRGPLVITAYDRAGNSASVTKSVNVDDEMGDILTGEAVVSYDSATLYGTVTTRDEYLAADGYGIEYRKASDTEWTSALPDAGTAKDGFSVVLNGLTPDTDYVYRTFVRSMANVMHYGEIKTFHTAAAPLTDTEVVSFYLEGQIGDAVISHDDETAGNGGTITVTVPY